MLWVDNHEVNCLFKCKGQHSPCEPRPAAHSIYFITMFKGYRAHANHVSNIAPPGFLHSPSTFQGSKILRDRRSIMGSCSASLILVFLLGFTAVYSRSAAEDIESSEAHIRATFKQWCSEHGKSYTSAAERVKRFGIFRENLLRINAHNSGEHSYTLGLNHVSDLSNGEMNERRFNVNVEGFVSQVKNKLMKKKITTLEAAPDSVNWVTSGAVTTVKDIAAKNTNCSAEWAFATSGAVEGINKIATKMLLTLSTQQLIDCVKDDSIKGCSGGFPQYALDYVTETGLLRETDYPYTGTQGTCKRKNGYVVITDGADSVWPSSNDTDLLEAVAKQPVTAMVDAKAAEFKAYKKGVYTGPCSGTEVSLPVLIVGYGTENGTKYWLLKNSWGKTWGEEGYMKLQRNGGEPYGRCAINAFPWFPLKAAASGAADL